MITLSQSELIWYAVLVGFVCFVLGLLIHLILDHRAEERKKELSRNLTMEEDVRSLKSEVFNERIYRRRGGKSLRERIEALEESEFGKNTQPLPPPEVYP